MAKFVLKYFGPGGRAEPIRLILQQAGQEYEDVAVKREEWPSVKPTMPLGQLPILEIDGKIYAQSFAIMRMLARRFNLYGSNAEQAFLADQFVETYIDVMTKVIPLTFNVPEDKKAESKEKLSKEILPNGLPLLEKLVKGNKFVVGDELTYADFFALRTVHFLNSEGFGQLIDTHAPTVKKIADNVAATPKIAAYLASQKK